MTKLRKRFQEERDDEVRSLSTGVATVNRMHVERHLTADEHAKRIGRIMAKALGLGITKEEIEHGR